MTIGYCLLAATSKFGEFFKCVLLLAVLLLFFCFFFSTKDASTVNELYFEFCSGFLNFWDTFLLPSRLPIFAISWHVLTVIESQVAYIL